MQTLYFTRAYPPYNAGEHATFDARAAADLLARGVAAPVAPAPDVPPVEASPEPPKKKKA